MGAVLVHYGAAPVTPRGGWTPVKCPFHDDRSPSAAFSESEGRFHCFVCGIHEDAIGLIMEREHVDFQTAVSEAEAITGQSADRMREQPEPGGWFPVRQRNNRTVGRKMGAWRNDLAAALS